MRNLKALHNTGLLIVLTLLTLTVLTRPQSTPMWCSPIPKATRLLEIATSTSLQNGNLLATVLRLYTTGKSINLRTVAFSVCAASVRFRRIYSLKLMVGLTLTHELVESWLGQVA